ncbi:MAG TPA: ATP-binding protein [Anaeromyxobacter sp.]|nr:ATP-binding protein [Anaeromyxobacter sp.]
MTPGAAVVLAADVVSTVGFGAALAFVLRRRALQPVARTLLSLAMALYAFVGVSNVLQHAEITGYLDLYEDYAEILFIPCLLFFAYSVAADRELRRRVSAEAALGERERELRTLVANLPGAVYRSEPWPPWRVQYLSEAVVALTGHPAAAYLVPDGLTWADAVHPDDAARVDGAIAEALEARRPYDVEYRVVHADGHPRWVHERGQAMIGGGGRPLWIDGVIFDVSDRKALEARLLEAQKLEAVGRLAGGVAHDFNNLLTAILGCAHAVRGELAADHPWASDLDAIIDSADRSASLTRGLLAFSRRQRLSPAAVDLNAVVSETLGIVGRLVPEHVRVREALDPEPLVVMADASQIGQVLVNLVLNARDAMPDGGEITVRTGRRRLDEAFVAARGEGAAGEYAQLSVADDGVGMDAATQERIFEPFFTTKGLGKGTGLGLATVYGTVRQHDGFVTVRSEPGRGSTFDVTLPLAARAPSARTTPVPVVASGSETVLVAEDDAAVRSVTRRTLERAGYRVVEARDGEEAVQLFAAHAAEIALVLLDVVMPRKTGHEALEAIRAMAPGVRAMFTSGYDEDVATRRGVPLEDVRFLSKPHEPRVLLRAVREVLDAVEPGAAGEARAKA